MVGSTRSGCYPSAFLMTSDSVCARDGWLAGTLGLSGDDGLTGSCRHRGVASPSDDASTPRIGESPAGLGCPVDGFPLNDQASQRPRNCSSNADRIAVAVRSPAAVARPLIESGVGRAHRHPLGLTSYEHVQCNRAPGSRSGWPLRRALEFETTLDEVKTQINAVSAFVLRSKTPDGVRQEAYGYLCLGAALGALRLWPPPSQPSDSSRARDL